MSAQSECLGPIQRGLVSEQIDLLETGRFSPLSLSLFLNIFYFLPLFLVLLFDLYVDKHLP